MIRQLLISIVVIALAFCAYAYFVPGAPETLARFGIEVPFAAAATPPSAATSGPRQGGGPGGPGGQRGGPARTLVVVTTPVKLATINDSLSAIGEGAAVHSVTVMSPASGTLAELQARPGQIVAAGAPLAQLDADAEQIAFERATLSLQDAEAAFKRITELARANNATTVQVNAAQLALSNARLEMQNAELALRRRSIATPIAGEVGLFRVSPGNTVSTQTVVTTIEDISQIRVSFWVPERYAPFILPGMPVTASAVALPGIAIAGEVSAVDNRIDPASRTLQVEAEIPNADRRLKPGMSFSVSLAFPGESFPSVDPLSIQWSSGGAYLWKYLDGKVERVPVTIIQRNSDGVLVKAELAEGDQVVTQGVQQLTAGATVRLLDEPAGETGDRQQQGQARP